MYKLIVPNEEILPQVARMLADGINVVLPVAGNSMLPFIVGGQDSVLLQKTSTPLHKGEIVLAQTVKGEYVVHRIIACNKEQIILMGDGNLRGTEICQADKVLGVVIKIIKGKQNIDCRSLAQRIKAELWYILLPFRRYLLAVHHRIKAR